MKQVFNVKGNIEVHDVPVPTVMPGYVLVRTAYSAVSVGTEMSSIAGKKEPLILKAMKRPDLVAKVVKKATDEGVSAAVAAVKGKVGELGELGYSVAGRVIAVGDGAEEFAVGDRVACAGAGYASHAEVVCVPKNLVVKVPEIVGLREAAFTTLGAIALQGVRRVRPELGEIVLVTGLGLLGLLTVQILKATGCHVIGVDLDRLRLERAQELGADLVIHGGEDDLLGLVSAFTGGTGADAAIITAATESSVPANQAMEMLRKKGRVVIVGAVGMDLDRTDFYMKELDFLISTSYGPGRYDPVYEEKGIDYPLGYVRWTEKRNMQAFISLLAEKSVVVEPLIEGEWPVEEAPQAYAAIKEKHPIGVALAYPEDEKAEPRAVVEVRKEPFRSGAIRVAVVGAGGFATGVHLPNIRCGE